MKKTLCNSFSQTLLTGSLVLPIFLYSHGLSAKESVTLKPVRASVSEAGISRKTQQQSNSLWANWLLKQVISLPSYQALEKSTLVAEEQKKALEQPLFNPELSGSYTDKNDETYDVIVSQTIDLFDRRSANTNLGNIQYDLAQLHQRMEIENRLAEALMAYIEYSIALQLLDIARGQEAILSQISQDLSRREKVGDVGKVDAEMAYLSLSQNLQQINLTEIRFRKAKAQLQQALNSSELLYKPKTSVWFNSINEQQLLDNFNNGFKVKMAQKQLEQAISHSNIARLNKKVNPTIGLGAGRDSGEDTIVFEISIPLNIRNNFSAEYNAALHKVNQSEFELEEHKRQLKNEMEQSFKNYIQLKNRVQSWEKLTGKRLSNSQSLLNKQWKSRDISTSDYLFALNQRTDALISTIELNGEMQKAWVEWLQASSQVKKWLKSL